jgi:hypothetical protein
MKVKILVCKRGGHEQRIETYSREEAEQRRIQLVSPRCEHCGSGDVELRD